MEDGRIGVQYGKSAAGHPPSPAMPSPLTPVDGSSFYPTATDVDAKPMMLSPRFGGAGSELKSSQIVLSAPLVNMGSEQAGVIAAPYCSQFQFVSPPAPAAVHAQQLPVSGAAAAATASTSLLADFDDIDALQCQFDMKHFEPGKLTESDLTCLDTAPAASSGTPASAVASTTSVFSPYTTMIAGTAAADPSTSFPPVFSSPQSLYHPYYQQQQQAPPQQVFGSEFSLDYSTPEVKELLCTDWLGSGLLNVN